MTWLRRDVRLAARKALRHPAVSGLIVVCLALGIGLNAAVFGIADAALLRPLPYDDPERLVLLHDTHRGPDGVEAQYPVSPLNFLAWREAAQSLERLEAMEIRHLNLTIDGVPRRVPAAGVTAGLFGTLGVEPHLGRGFTPEEDAPRGRKVAILGHGAWQRTFDGDPEALGRTLLLDGERYEIVGVLPPDFRFLADAEIWIPLALDRANLVRGRSHYLSVLGRLADGASPAQAAQELTAVSRRRAETRAPGEGRWGAGASDLRESLVGDARTNLVILLSAAGLVLLIACSNVTSLLLTRSMEQRPELAVRAAFGAGRNLLVRMMATESAVLTAAGAALGLLIAAVALRALPGTGAFGSPLLTDVGIDARVLGFALLVSIGAGVVPGVVVAWRSSGSTLLTALEDGGRSSTVGVRGRRFQAVLVVTQVCLTTALLVGAGLVTRSLTRLQRTDLGFQPEGVLKVQIDLPTTQYPEQARIQSFWRSLVPRLERLGPVRSVGVTSALPVTEEAILTSLAVEGSPIVTPEDEQLANLRRISPGYLRTLGIPLIEGRSFDESDDSSSPPTAVVSRSFAERYWPSRSAIGRRIKRGGLDTPYLPWRTVIGVVDDVQDAALGESGGPTLYIPMTQGASPHMHLVLRTEGPPQALVSPIRDAVQQVDPLQPISSAMTMEEHVSGSLSRQRLTSGALTFFGALGAVLSTAGIFGLLSYSVSRRSNELAVRMALGASHGDLQRLVLGDGLKLTGAGILAGSVFALGSSRLLSSLLFEISPSDPWTFAAVGLSVLVIGFAASFLPARSAASSQPATILRNA